jgi:hypothetical protein
LDLAEGVRTNRKTLAPNQKQLSAEVRRRAVVSDVEARGFEPRVALYLLPYTASVGSTEATSDQSNSVWQADTRSRLGGLALSGEGAFQAQRAAREAIEDAQAVEFPVPSGFVRERVTTWKKVIGLAVPIGPCRAAPSRPWLLQSP